MLERNTIVSKNVINLLESSNHPLNVSQILDELAAKKVFPNKATIYRILKKLKTKDMVNEFTVRNGTSYFELSAHSHHHHFICQNCDKAYCLSGCHMSTYNINLDKLLPSKEFTVSSHDFNLYGVCESCH